MASTVVTQTNAPSADRAAAEIAEQLKVGRGGASPRGGVLFTTVHHDTARLQAALRKRIPGVPFVGTTSCRGVGAAPVGYTAGPTVVGLWLLGDGFRFGVAAAEKSSQLPSTVGKELAAEALRQGGFAAAEARFAMMFPTPGDEEGLLAGIYQTLDKKTPMIGGSAADDEIAGKWSSFTHEGVTSNGVVLAICDWPWRLIVTYEAGYLPTGKSARVTGAEGRKLLSLDNRPAADVYNEWIGGKLTRFLTTGGIVLAETTMHPLGVPRRVGVAKAYVLIHPERVIVPERALGMFADIAVGQEVALMSSSPEALVQRGAGVARAALMRGKLKPENVVGGLMVYCAGCALAVGARMPEMLGQLQAVLGRIPFVSVFTFGEQGNVLPGVVDHGNLMASVLLLSDR